MSLEQLEYEAARAREAEKHLPMLELFVKKRHEGILQEFYEAETDHERLVCQIRFQELETLKCAVAETIAIGRHSARQLEDNELMN